MSLPSDWKLPPTATVDIFDQPLFSADQMRACAEAAYLAGMREGARICRGEADLWHKQEPYARAQVGACMGCAASIERIASEHEAKNG